MSFGGDTDIQPMAGPELTPLLIWSQSWATPRERGSCLHGLWLTGGRTGEKGRPGGLLALKVRAVKRRVMNGGFSLGVFLDSWVTLQGELWGSVVFLSCIPLF